MPSTFEMTKPLFEMVQTLIIELGKILVIAIAPIYIMIFFYLIYFYIKGERKKKSEYRRNVKKVNKLKELFINFPKRLVLDWYRRDPDALNEYGVHIFAGEQGAGKTIAVVWFIEKLRQRYPACQLGTNIEYKAQDFKVEKPEDFTMRNNGVNGMIIFLDEIQNWFCSLESKNFPVEALQDISQQRKQRKVFVGTSQVFTRVAKPIREQTTLLYRPFTIAGCLTVIRVCKATLGEDGTVKKQKLRKVDFFVHTDELRTAYDTYERVLRLSQKGYKPRSEQLTNDVRFSVSDLDIPTN